MFQSVKGSLAHKPENLCSKAFAGLQRPLSTSWKYIPQNKDEGQIKKSEGRITPNTTCFIFYPRL